MWLPASIGRMRELRRPIDWPLRLGTNLSYRTATCPRATQPIAPCRSQSPDGVQSGNYSLTSAVSPCSGCVHVRRGQHSSPTTEPSAQRPPPRPRPQAHRVRQGTRHHDPAARPPPTSSTVPLRHHPGRTDPRAHLPRPASRRGARGTGSSATPPVWTPRPEPRAPRRRARRPAARPSLGADPRLARLPTPAQIAAEVRRRPIGAVIADICRDLGIMPNHPLWRELQLAIIRENGNLCRLVMDLTDRAVRAILDTWPPGMKLTWPAPPQPPAPPSPTLIPTRPP